MVLLVKLAEVAALNLREKNLTTIGCDLAAVHIIRVSTRPELMELARDDLKRVPVNRLEQINALKP